MDVSPGERIYGAVARTLHWLVAGLLAAQFAVGWTMPHIRKTTPQEGLVEVHLSLGALLLFVVVARLVWRIMRPTPLTTAMKPWERKLARGTHDLLYLLLLVIPILGWAASGYFGYTPHLFGMTALPPIANGNMEWAHTSGDVHTFLGYVLLGVVGLHVAGALYHYFFLHDRVMQRMLPGV